MSKAKIIAGAGIIAAGAAFSGLPQNNNAKAEKINSVEKEIVAHTTTSSLDEGGHQGSKRNAEKVYHRFEDIPAISDKDAVKYNKDEYIYIINADKYQKTGDIELKRVLKDEVTKANALSLIYRSECQTYIPKQHEDQLSKYVIDLRIMSRTGITKGPSQMDDNAIRSFVKYLAANPETRKYVLPLVKASKGTTENAAKELEKKFFDENGDLRPMDERDAILHGSAYKNLSMKEDAWLHLASPKLKKFIAQEEARMTKKAGRRIILSNTTKNYLCLTEMFPSEELLKRQIEDYNLAFYQLGRPGKTKHVTAALARSMNLKDEHGNLDATRLPPFAIAAAISSINWQGNGNRALRDAQSIKSKLPQVLEKKYQVLREVVKNWVTGKSKRYGVDEMYELNILTPDIIRQYKELELSGSKALAANYHKAVEHAEQRIQIAQNLNSENKDKNESSTKQLNRTEQLKKEKTFVLTAIDFIRNRTRG